MSANANGTPTSLGIPTLNPGQDVAGPLGINEITQAIDSKIASRMFAPSAPADKQVVKWNNAGGAWIADFVKPSELAQEGATDGQAMVWSSASGKWMPGNAGTKTATSITALNTAFGGTPPDGAQGLLVLGTTPFEFLPLTYSATYSKWISDKLGPNPMWGVQTNSQTDVTAMALLGAPIGPGIPWKVYTDAGLSVQVRYLAQLSSSTGGAKGAHSQWGYFSGNAGGGWAGPTYVAATQLDSPDTINAIVLRDSGWITVGGTPTDYFLPQVGCYRTSGGGPYSVTISEPTYLLRFTS